jgi:two-component system, sensor histidine kinase and response regulator
MVMDLLDVGRESDGSLVPKKSVMDLQDLVAQVASEAAGRAQRRNLTLVVDPQGPRTVRADRELLRRVLENLLDNAFKYAPNGGRIALQLRPRPPGEVVVRVCDEGPGVPEAYRTKVFDIFFRLDRHAAEEARTSRGLGLSFCRLAVEAHKGRIWVEDNLPQGSAFCFSLPSEA